MQNKLKEYCAAGLFLLLPCAVWVYLFRGFITVDLAVTDDATPYLEHVKFFLNSIAQGIYPLWDPSREYGVPNEFFLRRIGSYNPFLLAILYFQKSGLLYAHAYMVFIVGYYFFGLFGFWLLARQVFKDRIFAYLAYWLMMFSSFSTVLFNSFLVLIFTPAVWFFYFLAAFYARPQRHQILGMSFTLMIILTTYLPFYFLTLLLGFIFWLTVISPSVVKRWLTQFQHWGAENKWLSFFCAAAVLISTVPGIQLFQEGKTGSLVLTARHQHAQDGHTYSVAPQTTVKGGILATNLVDELFSNHSLIRNGIFYVPVFAFLLFLSGLFCRLNKRIVILALWAFGLYTVGVYDASTIYAFFYKHIFFFKYMRNFQFFLWIVILPVFIVLAVEQFRLFLEVKEKLKGREKFIQAVVIGLLHFIFAVFLMNQKGVLASSYVVTAFSALFFIGIIFIKNKVFLTAVLFFSLGLSVTEPFEVYQHLPKNAQKYNGSDSYLYYPLKFGLPIEMDLQPLAKRMQVLEQTPDALRRLKNVAYIATKDVYQILDHVSYDVFAEYLSASILLYDRVESWTNNKVDYDLLEKSWVGVENRAFIENSQAVSFEDGSNQTNSPYPQLIHYYSKNFELVTYNPNQFKFKINLSEKKFLVYNNSYDSRWKAYINGKENFLFKANGAFRGIWVPAGENMVEFRYEPWGGQCWQFFMMSLFWLVLGAVFFYALKENIPEYKTN
jgi:hypothetical protein